MREVVKSIADRLCDEGLLECLSFVLKITMDVARSKYKDTQYLLLNYL